MRPSDTIGSKNNEWREGARAEPVYFIQSKDSIKKQKRIPNATASVAKFSVQSLLAESKGWFSVSIRIKPYAMGTVKEKNKTVNDRRWGIWGDSKAVKVELHALKKVLINSKREIPVGLIKAWSHQGVIMDDFDCFNQKTQGA